MQNILQRMMQNAIWEIKKLATLLYTNADMVSRFLLFGSNNHLGILSIPMRFLNIPTLHD